MKITISNDEGVVYGQYDVTTEESDTIEDMDRLDAANVYEFSSIMDTLAHDIPIYLKEEKEKVVE